MNPQMMNMLFNAMRAKGINFPSNINMSDPNQILDYLMKNGTVTQEQYNKAYQQLRSMYPQGNNNSR